MSNVIVMVVCLTIWSEARGEGEEGMKAVASVIWNRAGGDPWKLKDVCLAPYQFSCWRKGTSGLPTLATGIVAKDKQLTYAKALAQSMVAGKFKPTISASHYYSTKIMRQAPKWAEVMKEVAVIGNHKFYKETT